MTSRGRNREKPKPTCWVTLSQTVLLDRPPFVRAVQELVRTDQGRIVEDYYRVILPRFSICVALTATNNVITLWQYKHGPKRYSLAFPAGIVPDGEAPIATCRRELLEETGYSASELVELGTFVDSGNQEGSTGHYFVATGCKPQQAADSGDLETMNLRLMSWDEIDAAFRAGDIIITHHVAAWLLARRVLLGD